MENQYKIGIVADLSNNGSIHQETFIRAIEDSYDFLFAGKSNVKLVWENDYASFEGGQISAKKLIDEKVDCIVGHFSSSAANGALPYYERNEIPLLMPAATASDLTDRFNNAFRICSNDNHLTEFISEYFKKNEIGTKIYIADDKSAHGTSLSEKIRQNLANSAFEISFDEICQDIFYVGSYKNSIQFLKEIEQKYSQPINIYFTDDVLHPNLFKDIAVKKSDVKIFGFADSSSYPNANSVLELYAKKYSNKKPNIYYLETFAAMQVIKQLVNSNRIISSKEINSHLFDTVVGRFKFNYGESNIIHLAAWKLEEERLINVKIL